MKHLHFDSIYRPDFEVVEQRQGKTTLYPHTDQLPVLLRALNLEFYGALPSRLARTDHRADDFRRIMLKTAALMFCAAINNSRADGLCLFQLPDRNRVSKISIVQQITRQTRHGPAHHFRFYAGPDFFTEIYLNGKRVVFSDHALQRFSTRVPNPIGTDLRSFILFFFGSPIISLPVGPGPAFVIQYDPSLLALPFKETDKEFIVQTCLTLNEIHSMEPQLPVRAFNHHYDLPFQVPRIRNWLPVKQMLEIHRRYERKEPLPPPQLCKTSKRLGWHALAARIPDIDKLQGHGPGSRVVFQDDIPGPIMICAKPGQTFGQYDELAAYKREDPRYNWDAIFAQQLRLSPEEAKRYCADPPPPLGAALAPVAPEPPATPAAQAA